jgi:hypothetical protein
MDGIIRMNKRIKKNINVVAEQLGGSYNEIKNLAFQVVEELRRMKVDYATLSQQTDKMKSDLIECALIESKKNFDKFTSKFLTNPEFARLFKIKIFNELQNFN